VPRGAATFALAEARVIDSFVLGWCEVKAYVASVGPARGRPERPAACPFCDARRIWFNGWRFVFCVIIADDGGATRLDSLPLQRVVCSSCRVSWVLRPAWLYPHRSFALDVNEAAALAYLSAPSATYRLVACAFACSARSVWRWVGWLAAIVAPARLVALAEQLNATGEATSLIPREVPADHLKAYSVGRDVVLLRALQTLRALGSWARAQVAPPLDPSPLRFYLHQRFLAVREVHLLVRRGPSPALPVARRPHARVQRPP
jgi:hypothetical protein